MYRDRRGAREIYTERERERGREQDRQGEKKRCRERGCRGAESWRPVHYDKEDVITAVNMSPLFQR